MTAAKMPHEADRQLPIGGEIFLDHVGHFVARPAGGERRAGARRLCADAGVGAVQSRRHADRHRQRHRDVHARLHRGAVQDRRHAARPRIRRRAGGPFRRASCCVLDRRRAGDAPAAADAGFAMRPLVQFQRPVDTASGPGVAAFTVVRLERGAMAEGRIQLLTHRTEDTVWQKRWLSHPNGALALMDLLAGVGRRRGGDGALHALHRPSRPAHDVRPVDPARSRPRRDRDRDRVDGAGAGGRGAAPAVPRRLCDPGGVAARHRRADGHARCSTRAAPARRWSCRSRRNSAPAHGSSPRMPRTSLGAPEQGRYGRAGSFH